MSCSFCAPEGAVADVEPHALFADEHLSTLTDTLTGTLLQYGDAGYDAARLGTVWAHEECLKGGREKFSPETHPTETWNLDSCEFPAAICVVAGVPDVQACVRYCAASGERLAVAGGRHSHTCMAQDAFVVDLQKLRSAKLEKTDGGPAFLRCGGGALNGDAHKALDQSGYGMTLGHHPGTGLGGLVQQGGHGPLEKLYGLSIDAWIEATVVTADGASRVASATEHPDLFWALRGGCGNFGVVTEFLFELMPFNQYLPSLQRVHLPVPVLCPSRFDVIRGWRDMCGVAPRNVSPLLIVTPTPLIELTYAIAPDDTVETLKQEKYTGWGMPVVVELTTRCYVHEISWDILGPSSDANLAGNYYPTSALLAEFPDEACAIVADHVARAPNADCGVICNQLGGKAAEVPRDATAVYHRDAGFWLIINAGWKGSLFASEADERDKAVAWAKGLRDALLPYAIGRYGALSQDAADGWNDACGQDPLAMASWGANYGRLRELKAKYDPTNLFRINHNIEPRLK